MNLSLNDFNYYLPKELIAQEPVMPRDSSKLLVVYANIDDDKSFKDKNKKGENIEHKHFYSIIDYFQKNDVLVLNNTKVLPNKLYGKKATGGKAIIIIEGKVDQNNEKSGKINKENDNTSPDIYRCRVETSKPKKGTVLLFDNNLKAEIVGQEKDFFLLRFCIKNIDDYLLKYGKLPTPSYVRKMLIDDSGYQTEYAKEAGSLAAPTSGLHFTKVLLEKLKKKGVKIVYLTLHISFGTFARINETKSFSEHKMDSERFEIPKETADAINNRSGRLILCGTTSFKTLESSSDESGKIIAAKGSSNLFIYPGYKFKVKPDMMITNFHLPKSTLILLVSAYWGRELILSSYEEAVRNNYRFFSLGDSMLLIK